MQKGAKKFMNGYAMMSAAYRKAAENGYITKEQALQDCKIFDFLSLCSDKDICKLFDSSAFNEIAKSYIRTAVRELENEGMLEDEQARAVRNRFSLLLDEKKAADVLF